MSELKDLTLWTLWQDPYGQNKVSLWKWLEMSDLIKPYQNDQIQWEMNEMKWIEVNRGKMSDLMDLTLWTLWESPYGRLRVSLWKWLGTTLWESPYGRLRVSLSKWLEWTLWECPYQNEWNRWEMNEMKWIEVNRGKMSDLMDLMRSTLWKSPYGR